MKKLITILFVCLLSLLLAIPSFGFYRPDEWAVQSSAYTADQNAIVTGKGWLYGFMIATDGTNDVTDIKVYDSLTATGTQLLPTFTAPTGAEDRHRVIWFDTPVAFNTGVSIDITLAVGACAYMVFYRLE
jgi:hypothetical protein